MRPLLNDASFQRIGLVGLFARYSEEEFTEFFRALSSGHKIVVKIILELIAYLEGEEPTLVLIDEPETHLHPPLTAAFLRSVRECLETLNGFAVIATHSPVVLQELPSRYVRVLRRVGNRASMESPEIETFGEAIGSITQHVFNLDDGSTDWHATLKALAENHSLKEIEELFGGDLGFAARSFVASERMDLED
jgi:predicted ATP-binding protein involved in virulence